VRISELSRRSGVALPTIKYYLREGLLPAGARTSPNQADYSERHLHRLRLIRALVEVGGLRLSAVRAVVAAIDDEKLPLHELLGVAQRALGPPPPEPDPAADEIEARADIDRFLAELGWSVGRDAPARRVLADALVSLRRTGRAADARVFEPYARVAERLAAREVGRAVPGASRSEAVEASVVGTVVFEAALVALRRLAHEHHSAQRSGRERRRGAPAAR
jgi:DNA-binding transcriptional MerR regulator